MIVSYDGTDFCGWQKQKDHAFGPEKPSIQETIEKALEKIFQHPIDLNASGRTDAGVHAIAQVTDFKTNKPIPKDLCWALKGYLPDSIAAKSVWLVPDDFHSTISAEKKTYRYWIWNQPRQSALLNRYTWWVRKPLDLDYLNKACEFLIAKQDFASFRSVGSPVKHTIREVYKAHWRLKKSGLVEFKITGNGFLKQMVRNIVGTQVDLMLKKQPVTKMAAILDAKDRTKAGPTAPPQGLFLEKVYYSKDLDNRCRQI